MAILGPEFFGPWGKLNTLAKTADKLSGDGKAMFPMFFDFGPSDNPHHQVIINRNLVGDHLYAIVLRRNEKTGNLEPVDPEDLTKEDIRIRDEALRGARESSAAHRLYIQTVQIEAERP